MNNNDTGAMPRELPNFRRAREYHLYDDKGNRYLDLWQNNGRSLMGHRPGKFSQYLKNSISRGMWADYPNPAQHKLKKTLLKLFPEYSDAYLFRNRERALAATSPESPQDPLQYLTNSVPGSCWDWRPLLPAPPEGQILYLRLPIAGTFETQIILSKKPLSINEDSLSPIILNGLQRLWDDYRNWSLDKREIPRILLKNDRLLQSGPYLIWKEAPSSYDKVFQNALDLKLLIPPETKYPLMIPMEMSDYENKLLTNFLEELL